MQLVALKLRSGEEIIARVEETLNESVVKVTKPRLVVPVDGGDGRLRPMFMPWLLSDMDGTMEIKKDHVAVESMPCIEMEKLYLQHTSSIALK